jgi:SAM-dependent methyltransferase
MTVFDGYARYYDLLYRDKDYEREAQHVHEVIQTNCPGALTLMEMGCGTGGHALHLANRGYQVHGIDQSRSMLDQAIQRTGSLPSSPAGRVLFSLGDIREVRVGQRFDAVVALFHVISYLPTNHDLKAAFQTAQAHLNPGGIFLFDCWYGPAVLSHPPSVRIKRMQDDALVVVRIAEPCLQPNNNLVQVNYQLFITNRSSGHTEMLKESHCMRYLFKPEIEWLLKDSGITLSDSFEWMTGRQPGSDTWGVCFLGVA